MERAANGGKGRGNGAKGESYYGAKGANGVQIRWKKAIGKGLDYWVEDDYLAARGDGAD